MKAAVVSGLLALLSGFVFGDDTFSPSNIGYGVQKLKRTGNKGAPLKAQTTCDNVEEYKFEQAVVDNFAPFSDQKFWAHPQRYWLNRQFWGGVDFPIFVFIGGEGQESCARLTNRMYLYTLAQEHRALLVNVEHRFYGQSYPTETMDNDEIKLLSSQQALADLARIIGHIKTSLVTKNSRVITVGGSYPGNMAAWFRLKYPSVTYGSIASSAPLIAQTNFPEYMDVVTQSIIHFSGQACVDALESAANTLLTKSYAELQVDFNTCSTIKNQNDLTVLFSDLMGNVQGTIQYNNEHNGVMNVTDICAIMNKKTPTFDAYRNFIELQSTYRTANGQDCEDANFEDVVAYLSATEYDPTNAGRPWTYQTCNEFGYFQTTDSPNQPFHNWTSLNLDFSRLLCEKAFGVTTDPQVDWMNQVYGDVHIAATNVLFPTGTIDPWHALGVTNYTHPLPNPTEQVLYIEGTAHCNDLYAPANSDPAALSFARQIVAAKVTEWIKQ